MYLDDIKLNTKIVTDKVKIERADMLEFAGKYDPFPMHTDDEYAKSTRYGAIIAPGIMAFMSVWNKYVEKEPFGNELIAGRSTKVEWFLPVFAEDVLYGIGTITRIERRNRYNGIAELTLDVYNQNEELVIRGVVESVVKYRVE